MMTTTQSVLRRGIERQGADGFLTLDPAFQGLPDTAHGGSVLAAFLALDGSQTPCEVRGLYRKRVPLGIPLRLSTAHRDGTLICRLFDGEDAVLVEGRVGPGSDAALQPPAPGEADGRPLPLSSTCFACGVENPLGLQARLAFDARAVWGVWRPSAGFAADDGTLAPIALTALLDEAAFWLGALTSGESGMTTDLVVTLRRAIGVREPITVIGARDAVKRRPDDERYWDTEVAVCDADRRVIAHARITFVAIRGAAKRLVAGLLARNPPDVIRHVFPAYTQ